MRRRSLVCLCLCLPWELPAQSITVGSRIRVVAAVCARPDTLVSGTGCGTGGTLRTVGDKGTVLRGPAGGSTPFGLSWYVHYDVAPDGWSTAKYLALDSVPPPPPVPVATTVTINQPVIEQVGQRTPLFATVRDQFGMVQPFPITWASRRPNIATVDTNAVVTGIAPGIDTVTATSGAARAQTLVTILAPAPPPPVAGPVGCGVRIPPPVGCGMPEGTWALLGVDTVSRGYGPWFELDSLHRVHKVVRVTVSDTTP